MHLPSEDEIKSLVLQIQTVPAGNQFEDLNASSYSVIHVECV